MNKERTIINAPEESASEFACKFSACQQEAMSHEEGGDPFMVVHDRAEQSKVHADIDKDGYQLCGIIKKNATSGVPNNYAIDFRNKVHVGSNGTTEIDTSIYSFCSMKIIGEKDISYEPKYWLLSLSKSIVDM